VALTRQDDQHDETEQEIKPQTATGVALPEVPLA
jgi:hypothetical protein